MFVARYGSVDEVVNAFDRMPPSLTATLHVQEESELANKLSKRLAAGIDRLVFNGYPTGARVSRAQHHEGPWQATNSQHTSVGVTAIRRFLRPFVWQNAPESVLPEELRESFSPIPRRVDGRLVLPTARPSEERP